MSAGYMAIAGSFDSFPSDVRTVRASFSRPSLTVDAYVCETAWLVVVPVAVLAGEAARGTISFASESGEKLAERHVSPGRGSRRSWRLDRLRIGRNQASAPAGQIRLHKTGWASSRRRLTIRLRVYGRWTEWADA
jgi:hypothetical protein